jgi:Isochorismatase family
MSISTHHLRRAVAAAALLVASLAGTPALAQTLIDEWNSAKLPPPPELKSATLVPRETALLVMDFTTQTCTAERRPRCAASVAKVRKLVEDARSKGATIIYSVAVPNSTAADILKDLTPAAGEQVLPPLGPSTAISRRP